MLLSRGLNLGLDFTGGIIIEVKSEQKIDLGTLRDYLHEEGYSGATLQNFGDESVVLIRIQPKQEGSYNKEVEVLKGFLSSHLGSDIEFRKVDYVGPKVGKELVMNGVYATLLALLMMMLYIWLRFDWQFGVGAVIALLHDMLFTLGFYSLTRIEFDLTSIVAILTVIGYSINDSVVIFDRIRENIRKYKQMPISELINVSINETLSRTVMTVLVTLIACLALVIFGGEVIFGFSIAMLVGIAFGTYSSIYISAPILIYSDINKSADKV
jgi:preprotein translocase SecF subunit